MSEYHNFKFTTGDEPEWDVEFYDSFSFKTESQAGVTTLPYPYNSQYRPISDYEIQHNDPLSSRLMNDLYGGVQNYLARVSCFPLILESFPSPYHVFSESGITSEHIILPMFAARPVPAGFNKLACHARIYIYSGTGTVVFRLYAIKYLSGTLSWKRAQLIGSMPETSEAAYFQTSSGTAAFNTHTISIPKKDTESYFSQGSVLSFALTARPSTSSVVGALTDLSVYPIYQD